MHPWNFVSQFREKNEIILNIELVSIVYLAMSKGWALNF